MIDIDKLEVHLKNYPMYGPKRGTLNIHVAGIDARHVMLKLISEIRKLQTELMLRQ